MIDPTLDTVTYTYTLLPSQVLIIHHTHTRDFIATFHAHNSIPKRFLSLSLSRARLQR